MSHTALAVAAGIIASGGLFWNAWKRPRPLGWLGVALAMMLTASWVQSYVEKRRIEENLTWTDPKNKDALETGLMALGGFRGLLADILWVRAIHLQESSQYYELKLLGELIQKLQPTFTGVHAFQAYNLSYNLAGRAVGCEDKWYWIRSGISMLEKGLERNHRNYSLWFELGWQYLDRLGDLNMRECIPLRQQELPRLDDIPEAMRDKVFLSAAWEKGRARRDENLRWAAYYFYRSTKAAGDPAPLRTERIFGNVLDRLGFWIAKKPPAQCVNWDDWGSEQWWVEVRRRNALRGDPYEGTTLANLRFCMFQQIDAYQRWAERNRIAAPEKAFSEERRAREAEQRFYVYFPDEKRPMPVLMREFRKKQALLRRLGSGKGAKDPVEE